MENRQITGSILRQITLLFALGILAMGFITYISQYSVSDASIREQTEETAASLAEEVKMSLREYQAHEWLVQYWYEHADDMDIEYDVDYTAGTVTEQKSRLLAERYPDLMLKYADESDIEAMTEEDQKLYAEVAYSWLITRINEIKRAYEVPFLFCALTDDAFDSQFFLFSAADEGAVRGTVYGQIYPLGKTVAVEKSQQNAMQVAQSRDSHLAYAGDYVDYYSYVGKYGDLHALIGMTYDLSGLMSNVKIKTRQSAAFAVVYQIVLLILCLLLLNRFALVPLRAVQDNIRNYKNTKESLPVIEALSNIRPNNEIGRLSGDVSELVEEIDDYLTRIESISREKERVNAELNMAREIQAGMLPSTYPAFPDRNEFDIYATMDPAREVGGDFYDFFFVDEDHLCMVIADVSGKGIPAALFMMISKTIMQNNAVMKKSPAQILTDANNAICASNKMEMFVTVWLGILEVSTGKLTAANAGHEYPVLKRNSGGFELMKDTHGFVVGGMEGMVYREYELSLEPGDKLFLYTDGVPEAQDAGGELFGTDRMLAALNKNAGASTVDILKNVRSDVDEFVNEAEQFDDLTMLCMEYMGPGIDH